VKNLKASDLLSQVHNEDALLNKQSIPYEKEKRRELAYSAVSSISQPIARSLYSKAHLFKPRIREDRIEEEDE
jgi:hypothetical protein